MHVKDLLAKLVSFPVLGGDSNLSILTWIKSYIESFGIEVHLVPNEEGNKAVSYTHLTLPTKRIV